MATTTVAEIRQSTRVPTKLALTVESLNPNVNFSEACNTVSVNAQGCAIYSQKSIAISTPVLVRLKDGNEATGQIAFCKGSPSNDKMWGIGIVLDKPGNFWGINPCPPDWLSVEDSAGSPLSASHGNGHAAKTSDSAGPGFTHAEVESVRAELREYLRQEALALLADAKKKLNEDIQTQSKNTALAEGLLQESIKIRESASSLQSLQETIDQTISDGTKHAIERIEVCGDSMMVKTQSDSEQFVQEFRKELDGIKEKAQGSLSASLEKAQSQLSDLVAEKTQEVAEATSSIEKASDQIHTTVLHRLESDFETKQQAIASVQDSISAEIARFRVEVESIDHGIAKAREMSAEIEAALGKRLDETVSESVGQAQTSLQRILTELRNEQVGQARADMENMIAPISTRASSLIEELGDASNVLSRGRDETQVQIEAIKQTREETQLWLSQQVSNFEKAIENLLSDTKTQAAKIIQNAIKLVDDPIEKLNRDAKNKIDEFATRQQSELGEGVRRLRDILTALEQQAEDSLRASFVTRDLEKQTIPQEHFEVDIPQTAEKSVGRGQPTFAQKLSGLVRGKESK